MLAEMVAGCGGPLRLLLQFPGYGNRIGDAKDISGLAGEVRYFVAIIYVAICDSTCAFGFAL